MSLHSCFIRHTSSLLTRPISAFASSSSEHDPTARRSGAARAGRSEIAFFLGAPTPGVSSIFRDDGPGDDGRQYRARDQLLGDVREVPIARAGRLRCLEPLAAIPAVL